MESDEGDVDPAGETPAVSPGVTWGRRFEALARRRAAAFAPVFPWAPPAAVALARADDLSRNHGGRFTRVERMPTDNPRGQMRPASAPSPRRFEAAGPPSEPGHGTPVRPPQETEANEPRDADGERRDDHSTSRVVPSAVRDRLRRIVGPGADLMQVHTGSGSDALARAAGADAVTVGRTVHMRHGRFAPHREEGVALLAHEATHVAELTQPNRGWFGADRDAEEHLARERERDVLGVRDPRSPSPTMLTPAAAHPMVARPGVPTPPAAAFRESVTSAAPRVPTAPAGGHAPQTRAAAADRDLTAVQAGPDVESLRRSIVADVMRQLRTEFERGG